MEIKNIKVKQSEVDNKYFEFLRNISEDPGFKYSPDENDIVDNKKRFEEFSMKYKGFDSFLANSMDGNYTIKASVYPCYHEEFTKRVLSKNAHANATKKISSMYEYFIKDNTDILDFNRFALCLITSIQAGDFGKYESFLRVKEIEKEMTSYLNSIVDVNFINFLADKNYQTGENFFKIFNYKKLVGEKYDKGNPIELSKEELSEIIALFFPSDIAAIMKYSECGRQMHDHLFRKLDEFDCEKTPETTSENIMKLIFDVVEEKNMQPYIDKNKIYKVALFRLLQCMEEKRVMIDKDEAKERDFRNFIKLSEKVKSKVMKIEELDKEELPILTFENRNDSSVSFVTAKDLIDNYNIIFPKILTKMIKADERFAYYLLRNPQKIIDEREILSFTPYLTNKVDYIYLAYEKRGFLSKQVLSKCFDMLNEKERRDLEVKLIVNPNTDLEYFINEGVISERTVKQLYDNGTISFERVSKILDKGNESFAKKHLVFSGNKLAELYKTLYSKDIISILSNKERYSEQDVKRVLKENEALRLELTNRDIRKFRKELRFEREMFKNFATEENICEFVDSLGEDLGLSSYIALDLFNKGIISENQAKSIDTIYFKHFIECKNNNKYIKSLNSREVISNQRKLLNLISHKRVSDSDIIKNYARGLISSELYQELENENFKGKVDSKYLIELAERLKVAGKFSDYTEIERYVTECRKYAEDPHFFDGYDEKILSSKKIDGLKLVELGKRGLLSKNALSTILERGDISVIIKLIEDENCINIETAKELFQDVYDGENTDHHKRDLLEKVLRKGKFSNDEIFSILLETYRGCEGLSEEQKELNNENLQYFFNSGIMKIEIDDGKVDRSKTLKTSSGTGNGSYNNQDNQLRFPLFERFDSLFSIDEDTVFNKKGPALVFNIKSVGKTIIETMGTIKGDTILSDLTNHRTFIMDTQVFEDYKNSFTTNISGEEIIQYNKLIKWFDDNADVLKMDICKHSAHWKENVRKKLGVSNESKVDTKLVINKFKGIML